MIIGKVIRSGQFPILCNVNVMQALSMPGDTSTYASVDNIKIVRWETGILAVINENPPALSPSPPLFCSLDKPYRRHGITAQRIASCDRSWLSAEQNGGRCPEQFNIESWAVVLRQGGPQGPHMHPNSWGFGVYYVKLPTESEQQATLDADGIVFGQGKYGLHPLRKPHTIMLKPVEGGLILFPSYSWHHTIAIESSAERICIAFDLVSDRQQRPSFG